MAKVLVTEPVEPLGEVMSALLSVNGHEVKIVRSGKDARVAILREDFDIVLADYPLSDIVVEEFVSEVKNRPTVPSLIIMSAFASVDHVVSLMKLGIDDFIAKPFLPDVLIERVQLALQMVKQRSSWIPRNAPEFITSNPTSSKVVEAARRIASFDSSVLILGESGTGKEVIAKLIHHSSPRSSGEFIAINCAAIPSDLLESELFGHEEGAFTGATETLVGVFERASQGTLFLDEIGDMPLSLQVKLLRALQEREIKRVGGTRTISVNPRIIAATNREPRQAMADGILREDLYYRLATIELVIPPLRSRLEDVDLLTNSILEKLAAKFRRPVSISEEARRELRAHSWPGNVRELENALERALIFSDAEIRPEHLRLGDPVIAENRGNMSLVEIGESAAREAETRAILSALLESHGNKRAAARILRCSYKTLLAKVREYELQ